MQHRVVRSAQVYRTGVGGEPGRAVLPLEADEIEALTVGRQVQIRAVKGPKPQLQGTLARLDGRATAALGHSTRR